MSTTAVDSKAVLPTGTWQVDPVHSSVEFQVRNMGLVTVKGFFSDFDGTLTVAADGQAQVHGTVRAASVHDTMIVVSAHRGLFLCGGFRGIAGPDSGLSTNH